MQIAENAKRMHVFSDVYRSNAMNAEIVKMENTRP